MITRTNDTTSLDATLIALFAVQILLDDTVFKYSGKITALSPGTGNAASYDISFTVKRVGGVVAFVGAPSVVSVEDPGAAAWNVTVTIINTPGVDQVVVSVLGDNPNSPVKWYGELSNIQLSV